MSTSPSIKDKEVTVIQVDGEVRSYGGGYSRMSLKASPRPETRPRTSFKTQTESQPGEIGPGTLPFTSCGTLPPPVDRLTFSQGAPSR